MLQVNFEAYGSYVTDSLYQWDKNQTLNITGLSLTDAPEIHYANANMEKAIVRQSVINKGVITADIPNTLLQEPFTVTAYVGVYEGETFKVIEKINIPLIPKPRPMDYVFEDNTGEVYSYNALLAKMSKFDDVDFEMVRNYEDWVNRVKDTYLKDETMGNDTRSLLGLNSEATPSEALALLASNNHRMVIGSYVGAGVHGKDNPNKITFDFKPKAIWLVYDNVLFVRGSSSAYIRSYGNSNNTARQNELKVTWAENGIEWYLTSADIAGLDTDYYRSVAQANESAKTYYYVVLG